MTATTFAPTRMRPERTEVTLPAPVIAAAPVLISDCSTPAGGETLLSLLLRRMGRDD